MSFDEGGLMECTCCICGKVFKASWGRSRKHCARLECCTAYEAMLSQKQQEKEEAARLRNEARMAAKAKALAQRESAPVYICIICGATMSEHFFRDGTCSIACHAERIRRDKVGKGIF